MSVFAFVSAKKHDGMINASGIRLAEERLNRESFPSVDVQLTTPWILEQFSMKHIILSMLVQVEPDISNILL